VISCLAQALGNTLAQPAGETEKGKIVERTAIEILRHYERTNRAVGKDRDAAVRLLRIREAINAKSSGRLDIALEVRSFFMLLMLTDSLKDYGVH
jgi:nuclear pore complex protein Nup93